MEMGELRGDQDMSRENTERGTWVPQLFFVSTLKLVDQDFEGGKVRVGAFGLVRPGESIISSGWVGGGELSNRLPIGNWRGKTE